VDIIDRETLEHVQYERTNRLGMPARASQATPG
jgi:hypothetical protein